MSEFDHDSDQFGWQDLAITFGGIAVFLYVLYLILTP